MKSLIVWFTNTNNIIVSKPLYKNVTFKVLTAHIPNAALKCSHAIIDGAYTTHSFKNEFIIVNNEIVPLKTELFKNKELKIKEVKNYYYSTIKGIDYKTKKNIFVECVTSTGQVFKMNAGENAADKLDKGIRQIEKENLSVVPILRDFDNISHVDVPIEYVKEVNIEQGKDAMRYWSIKCFLIDQINEMETIQNIKDINIDFGVNTDDI